MLRRITLFLASFALPALLVAPSPPPAAPQVRPSAQQLAQPWALVRWKPVPENPVFTGTGRETWDRKIRERGYILPDDKGNFDLWYTLLLKGDALSGSIDLNIQGQKMSLPVSFKKAP